MIGRIYSTPPSSRSPSPELDRDSFASDNIDHESYQEDDDQHNDDIDSTTQDIIDQACEETCEIIDNAIHEAADYNYNAAYDECHDHFRNSSLRY